MSVIESVSKTDVVTTIFRLDVWRFIDYWYFSPSEGQRGQWGRNYEGITMQKGESHMERFARIDEIVFILVSLGEPKFEQAVHRRIMEV